MPSIGVPELLIVLVVVLLVLGPKRLPALGRQIGGGFKELREGLRAREDRDDDEPVDGDPAPGRAEAEPEELDGEVVADRKP